MLRRPQRVTQPAQSSSVKTIPTTRAAKRPALTMFRQLQSQRLTEKLRRKRDVQLALILRVQNQRAPNHRIFRLLLKSNQIQSKFVLTSAASSERIPTLFRIRPRQVIAIVPTISNTEVNHGYHGS